MKITTLFLSFVLAAAQAAAAIPGVGKKAPDFELQSVDGQSVRLSEETAEGKVVLVVLRGFPGYQCPFCNRQVQDLAAKAKELEDAGARVILIYPGPPENLEARGRDFLTGKKMPAGFAMLLDPGYKFTNLYDLRWDAPRETAYPATFVIDKNGVVTFAKISREHGGRTRASEVLDHLKESSATR